MGIWNSKGMGLKLFGVQAEWKVGLVKLLDSGGMDSGRPAVNVPLIHSFVSQPPPGQSSRLAPAAAAVV